MIKVGITGQSGFIGSHLYNTLGLFPQEFKRIEFEDNYFGSQNKLDEFVGECDVIVHLAAMNRHQDLNVLYETNLNLVKSIINSLEKQHKKSHILFSSSSQEERDNLYGKSKKEGRELFINWTKTSGGKFSGFVIPNVYGPFGKPFYNSVVATFCHQVSRNDQPKVDVDGTLNMIYVGELVNEFIQSIRSQTSNFEYHVPHTSTAKVSEILNYLNEFKNEYQDKGIIPIIDSKFKLNLFNTYRCYMPIESHFPVNLTKHTDDRGNFVEVIRLNVGGQVSFSTTVPGITRGNHYHTRKIERFAVIKGKALIQLRQIGTDKILDF